MTCERKYKILLILTNWCLESVENIFGLKSEGACQQRLKKIDSFLRYNYLCFFFDFSINANIKSSSPVQIKLARRSDYNGDKQRLFHVLTASKGAMILLCDFQTPV